VRILILNQYFRPDVAASAQRLTELAEDLASRHEVTALVGRPSYDAAAGVSGEGAVPRLDVKRVPSTAFARRRTWLRGLNYSTYLAGAVVRGVVQRRPDLVIAATDPPLVGLAGWLLGRRFGVPFVHLLWDVQPQVAVHAGLLRRSAAARLIERAARFAIRRAAGIVAPTSEMARTAVEQGAAPDRVCVIGHWEDTQVVAPQPKDNPFSREHGLADRFVVMYSGNLGLTQELGRYLDLAARLRDLTDLVFVFVGEGAARPALEARARAAGLANVRLLPYQPRERMAHSLASADVFFVPLGAGLTRYMLPSKIYTVMASGRPVVTAIDPASDVARLVREVGFGLVSDPGDLDGLERHLRWMHANPDERRAMGRRAREASEGAYGRAASTRRYLDWLRRFDVRA
jgi:glycosyltransferase involved in cell wall biosynthesis